MKMMRPILLLVLLTLVLPGAALAAEPGPYLEISGFGSLAPDSENRSSQGNFDFSFDAGSGGGIALGYDLAEASPDFGQGRIEVEAGYRSLPVDSAAGVSAGGEVTVKSLMLNTFAEYHNRTVWVPYAGIGAGYAEVAIDQATVPGLSLADDQDGVFAYQAGVGIGLKAGGHVTFDLGYRYFATLDPEFKLSDGSALESEFSSHNLLLGLRLKY